MTAETRTQTNSRPPVSPAKALLLSAVVLPGLGQMVTGRIGKGALMSVVPLLWLPVAVIKVVRDLYRVTPELFDNAAAGAPITLADLQRVMSPMAGDLLWLLSPLAAVWLWSLADSIMFLRRSKAGH